MGIELPGSELGHYDLKGSLVGMKRITELLACSIQTQQSLPTSSHKDTPGRGHK